MDKNTQTAAPAEGENLKVEVSRRQMVDDILGLLGPNGTLALWALLNELPNEDRVEAQTMRQVREQYLHGSEMQIAGIIFAYLKTWESDPATPVFDRFLKAMQEHTVFRAALKCTSMPGWKDESKRSAVREAVKLLRELFTGQLMEIKGTAAMN